MNKPNVKLITYTPNPEKIIAGAARLCYANTVSIDTLLDNLTEEKINDMVTKLADSGHASPFTQVYYTFAIENVTRAWSLQFARHHVGVTFDQRSQRYVNEGKFKYIIPDSVIAKGMEDKYIQLMDNVSAFYNEMVDAGIKKEDARSILPNSCETKLIATINAQELFHIFGLRCCVRAQKEFRQVANEMLRLVKEVSPVIFKNAGAHCDWLGYCPEGDMCCGRAPTMAKLLETYKGSK